MEPTTLAPTSNRVNNSLAGQEPRTVLGPVVRDFSRGGQPTTAKAVMKLGEILKRRRLISTEQLQQVLKIQTNRSAKTPLGELIVSCDLITDLDLQRALMEQSWRKQGLWVID